jgi:hypothetical protein
VWPGLTCEGPNSGCWGFAAVDQDVVHRLCVVAGGAGTSSFVSVDVTPVIPYLLGAMEGFVNELSDFESNCRVSEAVPNGFVGFLVAVEGC